MSKEPKIFLTTKRLIIREMAEEDQHGIFALDSDPEVLRFLPVPIMHDLSEARKVIRFIQKQYKENGIGRWAMVLKENNEFIGWCGIKLVTETEMNGRSNYYDIGYRIIAKRWGEGYATEATEACIEYAFDELKLEELNATVMFNNLASARVLEKCGLIKTEEFVDENGIMWHWYTIKRNRSAEEIREGKGASGY